MEIIKPKKTVIDVTSIVPMQLMTFQEKAQFMKEMGKLVDSLEPNTLVILRIAKREVSPVIQPKQKIIK